MQKKTLPLADGFRIDVAKNSKKLKKIRGIDVYFVLEPIIATKQAEKETSEQRRKTVTLEQTVKQGVVLVHNGETKIYSKCDDLNDAISARRHAMKNMGASTSLDQSGEAAQMHKLMRLADEVHTIALEYKDRPRKEFFNAISQVRSIFGEIALARVEEKVHARQRTGRTFDLIKQKNPGAVAATTLAIIRNLRRRNAEITQRIAPGEAKRENTLIDIRNTILNEFSKLITSVLSYERSVANNKARWQGNMQLQQAHNLAGAVRKKGEEWKKLTFPRPFQRHATHIAQDLEEAASNLTKHNFEEAHNRLKAIFEGIAHMSLRQEIESVRFQLLVNTDTSTKMLCKYVSSLLATARKITDDNLQNKTLDDTIYTLLDTVHVAASGEVEKTRELLKEATRPL